MALIWAAECKKCGKLSGVRESKSTPGQIDMPTPSEKIQRKCPHCGAKNVFLGSDLKEVAASVVAGPPQSGQE